MKKINWKEIFVQTHRMQGIFRQICWDLNLISNKGPLVGECKCLSKQMNCEKLIPD